MIFMTNITILTIMIIMLANLQDTGLTPSPGPGRFTPSLPAQYQVSIYRLFIMVSISLVPGILLFIMRYQVPGIYYAPYQLFIHQHHVYLTSFQYQV